MIDDLRPESDDAIEDRARQDIDPESREPLFQ